MNVWTSPVMSTLNHKMRKNRKIVCAIHHHLLFHERKQPNLRYRRFCLWVFLLHLVKTAIRDDQMRQKYPAAMQTCLSTWNKHFIIIQLYQHHMPLYELEQLTGVWLELLRLFQGGVKLYVHGSRCFRPPRSSKLIFATQITWNTVKL